MVLNSITRIDEDHLLIRIKLAERSNENKISMDWGIAIKVKLNTLILSV